MSFVLDTDICSAYLKGDRNVFTLVTHNTKHFGNVSGLRIQDWVVP